MSRETLFLSGKRRWTNLLPSVRVATFGMQAVAEDPSAANAIVSAAGALWELGFFALLYSTYILVLDR